MKKAIALILTLALVFALVGCGQSNNTAAPADEGGEAGGTLKVGVFMPLTGDSAYMGQAGLNGAQIAADEINAAGGINGMQIEIVSYDDKSSPEEAVVCVNKMLEKDKVNAIIGSLHSGNIQACGDIVEEAQIPLMGTGTSPQWLDKGWTYLFRPTINTYYTSLAGVQACQELGATTISIFHSEDEYGKNGKDNMVALCEEYGIDVLDVESMTPGDSDFTGQVANLKSSGADVLYIIATANNLPGMVKQVRAGGIDGYIIGEQSLGQAEVKNVAGDAANGIIYGACFVMPVNDPSEAVEAKPITFFESYLDKYGEMCPSEVAVRGYDAMYLLKAGFEKAGSTDGEAVRDALYTVTDYEGIQGTFDFSQSHDGEGLTAVKLFIIDGGKDVLMTDYMASK